MAAVKKKRKSRQVRKGLMNPQQSSSFWIFLLGMALAGLISGIAGAVATKMVNSTYEKAKRAVLA